MLIKQDSANSYYYYDDDDDEVLILPEFDKKEIRLGKLLGSGGFSDVYEIRSFHLSSASSSSSSTTSSLLKKQQQRVARIELASTAKRETLGGVDGGGRYAIKLMKHGLTTSTTAAEEASSSSSSSSSKKKKKKKKTIEKATKHLTSELRVLASLDHPNILKMRGLMMVGQDDDDDNNNNCYSSSSSIIVDRLDETLSDRINNRWMEKADRYKGVMFRKVLDRKGDKRREFLMERLSVGLGIAKALAYLHHRRMIHRDLKPANIGFALDGHTPILFDMGLCRTMPSSSSSSSNSTHYHCSTEEQYFEMSGKTGTVRYMSPEVRNAQPYNEKADVYSFVHVLWELLALEGKPYAGFSKSMHMVRVVQGGERPSLDPHYQHQHKQQQHHYDKKAEKWPLRVCDLLQTSWNVHPEKRYSMKRIQQILEEVITDLQISSSSRRQQQQQQSSTKSKKATSVTSTIRNSMVPMVKKELSQTSMQLVGDDGDSQELQAHDEDDVVLSC